MPIVLAFIPEIADALTFVGLTGGAIGGSVAEWCSQHPGPSCANKKRDILGTAGVPLLRFGRRDAVGPCNVPQYNFDQCHTQIQAQSIKVTSSIPSSGVAQFDNIPPACMDLAGVMGGSCTGDGPRPTPCGSACMQWTGLTDDQFASLSNTLNSK